MKVSWTRIEAWRDCHYKHHLKYNLRLKGKPDRSIFIVGEFIHKLVERWSLAGYPDDAWVKSQIGGLWEQVCGPWFKGGQKVDKMIEAGAGALTAINLYRQLGWMGDAVALEHRFTVPFMPGIELNGIADILDVRTGKIWDMKNYAASHNRKGHDGQLELYALALGKEPGGFLYPLREGDKRLSLYTKEWDEGEVRWAFESEISELRAGDMEPNPGNACYLCDFSRSGDCQFAVRAPLDLDIGDGKSIPFA